MLNVYANIRILRALLVKEVKLMMRSPFIPRMIVVMPLMVMLVMPLVANLDVKNVSVAVVDNDRTELSRRMAADIDASEYMSVRSCADVYEDALRAVEAGRADVVVTIPPGYSRDIIGGRNPQLDIKANGVDAMKGMLGARYAAQSATATVMQWMAGQGLAAGMTEPSVLNLYNPTLDFRNYMLPALMIILLIIICGFLPTLNLVGEKEAGTIEAMNVTPVGRFTFILSKLIPYWAVGILVITIGMLVARLAYGLAPAGSIAGVYLAAMLFSLVMSGLGVSIANRSATMLQSIFVMFAFIMVFQLMGGLFTPISSMPGWAQCLTYIVPTRYFIEIMRAIYLKGASFSDLWMQYLSLSAYALSLCVFAAATYRKRE